MTRALRITPLLFILALGQTENFSLLGTWYPPGNPTLALGLWGYAEDGREYALITTQSPGGVFAVDITNPANPKEKGFVASPNSIWQEVSHYRSTAFKVSQQGSAGLQIINLDLLAAGGEGALLGSMALNGYHVAHSLSLNPSLSPPRLHGTFGAAQGVVIYSLANPISPSQIGLIPGEANETLAHGNRLFVATQRRGTVEIWNVADASNPARLGVLNLLEASRELGELGSDTKTVANNIFLSEDGRTLFTSEEISGTSIKAFDVSNPATPVLVGRYQGAGSLTFRIFLSGNVLFRTSSHGLEALDVSNPAAMRLVGEYRAGFYPSGLGLFAAFPSGAILYPKGNSVEILRLESPSSLRRFHSRPTISPARLRGQVLHFSLPGTGAYSLSLLDFRGRQVFGHSSAGQGPQILNLEAGLGGVGYLLRLNQNGREFSAFASGP